MAIDCGSGESKPMLFQYLPDGPNGPHVVASQGTKETVAAVTDFLAESVKPDKGWGFLQQQPEDIKNAVLLPRHFLQFCCEQREIHNSDYVIVGVSAWFRYDFMRVAKEEDDDPAADPEVAARRAAAIVQHNKAKALIAALEANGFICKALHERTECFFEASSVAYAHEA